jgi:hypothetical protein
MKRRVLLLLTGLSCVVGCSSVEFNAGSAGADSGTSGRGGTAGVSGRGGTAGVSGSGGTAGVSGSGGSVGIDAALSDAAHGNDAQADGGTSPLFPKRGILDNFDRSDGPVGQNWVGFHDDFEIQSSSISYATDHCGPMFWYQAFSADQEAFVTIAKFNGVGREIFLTLKAQDEGECEHMEVLYLPQAGKVGIHSCTNGTWTIEGEVNAVFKAGDQLGGRARSTGRVEIYKNGVLLASIATPDFPYNDKGGRIGLGCVPEGGQIGYDDFGGG